MNNSTWQNLWSLVFVLVLLAIGLFFYFTILIWLLGTAYKAVVISIIIYSLIAYIICYVLVKYYQNSWYFWSIFLAVPMLILGVKFGLDLEGEPNAKLGVFLSISSGIFVLIGGMIGGYIGRIKKGDSQ